MWPKTIIPCPKSLTWFAKRDRTVNHCDPKRSPTYPIVVKEGAKVSLCEPIESPYPECQQVSSPKWIIFGGKNPTSLFLKSLELSMSCAIKLYPESSHPIAKRDPMVNLCKSPHPQCQQRSLKRWTSSKMSKTQSPLRFISFQNEVSCVFHLKTKGIPFRFLHSPIRVVSWMRRSFKITIPRFAIQSVRIALKGSQLSYETNPLRDTLGIWIGIRSVFMS